MNEWTIETLKQHFDALREADQRALEIKEQGDKEARRIKDESDKTALGLSAETQKYKDEKANELREQINRERNLYVTVDKLESVVKPLVDYVSTQQGKGQGLNAGWVYLLGLGSLIGMILGVISFFR